MVDVDFGLHNYHNWSKYDKNGHIFNKCGNGKKWFGFSYKNNVGTINTTLSGCGKATLNFGNCGHGGSVVFYKNSKILGIANTFENKNIAFEFFDGDLIEIQDHDSGSIMLFNNFLQDPCPGEIKIFIHKF